MSRHCYLSTLELHELDEACAPFEEAFGRLPFLVGSSSHQVLVRRAAVVGSGEGSTEDGE